MRCPRCQTEQAQAAECDRCGLVIDRWRAKASDGRGGRNRARTSDEQIAELKRLGREVGAEVQAQVGKARGWFDEAWQLRPIPSAPRVLFFRELGKALEAGLPPTEAFACLTPAARADRMGEVADDLEVGMQSGLPLHEVMRDHPEVFDRYERTVVEIAERANNVGPLLESLARRLDVMRDVGSKTMGRRPLALMLVPVACLLWPLPAASIFAYLSGVFGWTIRFAILCVALVAGGLWLLRNRELQDDLLGRAMDFRIIGPLIRRWRASDYLAALELCLRCRLAPRRAVTVAAVATGDPTLLASASKLVDALDQGRLLYEAAALVPDLPEEVREAIGDRSGRLSLANQARQLRRSVAKNAIRLGRAIHLSIAGIIIAVCVTSVLPMLEVDWDADDKIAATAPAEGEDGRRKEVEGAADRLQEMMPALKRADHRTEKAVRPAGGGIE